MDESRSFQVMGYSRFLKLTQLDVQDYQNGQRLGRFGITFTGFCREENEIGSPECAKKRECLVCFSKSFDIFSHI